MPRIKQPQLHLCITNQQISFQTKQELQQISEQIYINPIIKEEIGEDNFSRDNKIKLTCTFVNTDAKETKVEKEIVLHTEWTAQNVETELNYETIKYIPYASNEGNKIIVQGKVILNVKNYLLPIRDSKIAINVDSEIVNFNSSGTVFSNSNIAADNLNLSGNGTLSIYQKTGASLSLGSTAANLGISDTSLNLTKDTATITSPTIYLKFNSSNEALRIWRNASNIAEIYVNHQFL